MSDMIEKMARAIAEEFSAGKMRGRVLIDTDYCTRHSFLQEEVFAAMARAALSALQEPSEAMVGAGLTEYAREEDTIAAFTAMIKAAKGKDL